MADRPPPPRGDYLIQRGAVVSLDPGIGTLRDADVHVRDGRVVDVGIGLRAPGAEPVDASRMIVMPGLVDSHFHMWSTVGRN
jgi:5-methylthioadenosine/S-adenosylhomocysteine deaminase